MIAWFKERIYPKTDSSFYEEYKLHVSDLIQNGIVYSMQNYIQHGNTTCLEHCFYVSYMSYLVCRYLRLNSRSAARGGLLHDLFLYDWHVAKPERGLHGFVHPYIALENANDYFELNEMEKDIIVKHMWPLTIRLPRYKETMVVVLVDKYCAFMEIFAIGSRAKVFRIMRELA
jgi:uncharacterized protein